MTALLKHSRVRLNQRLFSRLWFIRHFRQKPQAPPQFQWTVGPVQTKTSPQKNMLEITITNEQKILVTLNPVTDTGTQAKLDGDPVWTQTSGLSTVEVDEENPLQAYLVSSDTPGESRFVVEADADLGEGVIWLADGIKLIVEGSRAVSLGLKTGEAVSKTPAEPPPAPAKK